MTMSTTTIYDVDGERYKIEPTSCRCGGSLAWLRERPSGAWEMVGCVCHTLPGAGPRRQDDDAVSRYGEVPVRLGTFALDQAWHEFMHYLYLPIRMPLSELGESPGPVTAESRWYTLPPRLAFLEPVIDAVIADARHQDAERFADPYVYVTARRGFATPGNPLNRPGWHCDDFGGHDLNYIWADRFPTRVLIAPGGIDIPEDDAESMVVMERNAAWAADVEGGTAAHHGLSIEDMDLNTVWRLSPYVIHDTPVITEGGMRSFFKISVSNHRYNLLGNSHNHLLDYDWEMHDREAVRNQPGGNRDYFERTTTTIRAEDPALCDSLLWSVHEEDGTERLHIQGRCIHPRHGVEVVLHSNGSEMWGDMAAPPDDLIVCSHGDPTER